MSRRKIIIILLNRPVQRFGREQRGIHFGVYDFVPERSPFGNGRRECGRRLFGALGREYGSRRAGRGVGSALRFGNAFRELRRLGVFKFFVALLNKSVM